MRDKDLHASELAHLPRRDPRPSLLQSLYVLQLQTVDDLSEGLKVGLAVAFLRVMGRLAKT
jgi:hypothetical protein